MTRLEDRDLIEAVLAGEKTAYGQLYDRYAPLVRAICCDTTGNLADAQDLAQDVFMRAYKNLENLRDPDRFGKWLVGIARLRCREWRRRNSKRRDKNIGLDNAEHAVTDPADDNRIEQLREMITMLPEKERLVLHTFYLQGNSAEAACRILGLSRSGLYRVLARARKQLEHLLTKEPEDTQ